MTMRDPEVVDLLRDEPELLALADAVADTQRLPSRRARRLGPRIAVVAALAAGIAAAVLFWPSGGTNNGVLGRAAAALGDDPILHLKLEMPAGSVLVDLRDGRRIIETMQWELWTDRDFQRAHVVMRVGGQSADFVLPDDARHGSVTVGSVDPAYAAFWTGYHEALLNGDAKLERDDTIDGRPVYWLEFQPVAQERTGTEVAIDQRTYKPVVIRNRTQSGSHRDVRVVVAETTAYHASDFERVGPNLFDGIVGTSSSGSGSVVPIQPSTTVRPPWLTAGKRVAGLDLTSVNPSTTHANGKTIEGVNLVYGEGPNPYAQPDADVITIDELSEPDYPPAWRRIPRGWISIEKGEGGGSDPKSMRPIWNASLVKDGIYVTISTGAGEDALLEAARALRPAG